LSAARAIGRFLLPAGCALAAALLLALMQWLSVSITRSQLIHEAQEQLASLREGRPLWRWRLRTPADLVAGRVFGPATATHGSQGVSFTSRDGSPFEFGLPLSGPVDARHWPHLTLKLHSDARGVLGLSYQARQDSAACLADDVAHIDPARAALSIDLHAAAWHTPTGTPCPPPSVISYLLRMRVQLPAGATVRIDEAALAASLPSALPPQISAQQEGVPAEALQSGRLPADIAAPLVRIPRDASAEAAITLRDLARQHWPAALVVPAGQALVARHGRHPPAWLDGGILGAYLLWLVALSLCQKPGVVRPWLETAAIAFGPLWLIAGLRWGPQVSPPGIAAFLAALAYGGISEWRRRPVGWSWLGRRPRDWLWPLAPLPVALILMMVDGQGLIQLQTRHILAYFAWALLQQWMMLAIVMGRLRRTRLPPAAIIVVTAGLFGLLHTPNGALMQLCLLAELWWAWCFWRSPRLLPVALAHALCALLVESGLTGHLLRSLEVSARFFL
jgi:hypothetical protein